MKLTTLTLTLLMLITSQIFAETEEACIANMTQWCARPRCAEPPEAYCVRKWQAQGKKAIDECVANGHRFCNMPRCKIPPAEYCKTHRS